MSNATNTQVLGSATALPATSAAGLMLLNHVNPAIVIGLFIVSIISFIILLGNITRFILNNRNSK